MDEKLFKQQFNEFRLVNDLLRITRRNGYGRDFRMQFPKPYDFEVFRVYLMSQEKEYQVRVELRAYPFDANSLPEVVFENLLPFCAVHPGNLHPTISCMGRVDWGAVREVPGTILTVTELLAMLRTLLAYPDHHNVPHSCSPRIMSTVRAGEDVPRHL